VNNKVGKLKLQDCSPNKENPRPA